MLSSHICLPSSLNRIEAKTIVDPHVWLWYCSRLQKTIEYFEFNGVHVCNFIMLIPFILDLNLQDICVNINK